MTVPWEILIVSSDLEGRRALTTILNRLGIDPICAATIEESLELLSKEAIGVVFCDQYLADGNYRNLLAASHRLTSRMRMVVISRQGNWDEYLEAMRQGAFDLIASPCRPTDVEWMVIQAKRDERNRRSEAASTAEAIT
ncbi:MAG TPA: response regulator [Candidatus Acidoferrales bacterium]|nr:response regulator [Candidatus Acidoferrales bacterium]